MHRADSARIPVSNSGGDDIAITPNGARITSSLFEFNRCRVSGCWHSIRNGDAERSAGGMETTVDSHNLRNHSLSFEMPLSTFRALLF
jgi:hypothetical protein